MSSWWFKEVLWWFHTGLVGSNGASVDIQGGSGVVVGDGGFTSKDSKFWPSVIIFGLLLLYSKCSTGTPDPRILCWFIKT